MGGANMENEKYVSLPIDLDDDLQEFFESLSEARGIDVEDLIVEILKEKKERGENILRLSGYSGEFPWNLN